MGINARDDEGCCGCFSCHGFLDEVIAPLLTRLNDKTFQDCPAAATFAEIDAPALLALPLQRHEMAHQSIRKKADHQRIGFIFVTT